MSFLACEVEKFQTAISFYRGSVKVVFKSDRLVIALTMYHLHVFEPFIRIFVKSSRYKANAVQ